MSTNQEKELALLINLKKRVIDQLLFFSQLGESDEEIHKLDNRYIRINLENRQTYLKNYLKNLDIQIEAKCPHNYVYDDIEIGLEQSQKIQYCTRCFETKPF